jgi:cell division protein FtsL
MNSARAELILTLVLAILVVVSGVSLTWAKHESRRLFVELEEINREYDRLQVDWDRLQLEQSTHARHSRIEALAREELDLAMPGNADVIVIAEPAR